MLFPFRPNVGFRVLCLLLTVGAVFSAHGQDPSIEAEAPVEASAASPAVGELLSARLRYGLSFRRGGQNDDGPGLSYNGMTPNDLALAVSYFGRGYFGVGLSVQREGFALIDDATAALVTSGGLWRAHLGPSARIVFGPLRLEALVGYGFSQLPAFGSSAAPAFSPAVRHSALLASRALVSLPLGFALEARGEFPISFAASNNAGQSLGTSGFSAGAALILNLGNVHRFAYSAVADYQFVRDQLSTAGNAFNGTQTLSRVGLALELRYLAEKPPPPGPRFGGLLVSVVDERSGKGVGNAEVLLEVDGTQYKVVTSDDGRGLAQDVSPGDALATVNAAGYAPGKGTGRVVAGAQGNLELVLKPKLGGLVIKVVMKDGKAPIYGATVSVGEENLVVQGPNGVSLTNLSPGPVEIAVKADGFRPAKDLATVVAFKSSDVVMELVELQKKVPATITGLVRSTRGGKPVAASLEIPEAKIRTRADGRGAFEFKLAAGTYSVIISAPGFLTQTKSVSVKEGDQAIFNVDLHPNSR